MRDLFDRFDRMVVTALQRWSVPILRLSLGIVFLWFGALKVFGVTPVSDLVAATVYWVDPDWFVPLLGGVEMLVGAGLILRRALRLILAVFLAQMAGTFLVLHPASRCCLPGRQPAVAHRGGRVRRQEPGAALGGPRRGLDGRPGTGVPGQRLIALFACQPRAMTRG